MSETDFSQLEQQIEQALQADRHSFRRQLQSLRQARRAGKPYDRNLTRLIGELTKSVAAREARRARLPAVRFDESLPVSLRRQEIADAIRQHPVVIVCGETGSGKSTQLPKICLELGRGVDGMIGHTQPRRIAARSVAARVAEELGTSVGAAVGFKIRFTDATSPHTFIKLMTDGILLAESQRDRYLNQYDTLIIDEAHERSLNIDFLIGYIQRLLPKRPDLKVIITSATIDAERFAEHFATSTGPAPIIQVSGRTYPVEVRYRPVAVEDDDREPDWEQAVLAAIDELAQIDTGDMLVFLPTERDIHEVAKLLRGRMLPGDLPGRMTEILPLYARLPNSEQNRVFQPHPHRRIVIATNVAESSLTVPGIRFVIDPGTARISRYSARSKMQRLPIEPISQASADQRQGRCGRVGPGICVRLYSPEDYESRERFTPPEIQRTNLASVILQTKALGFGEIEDFPFLDPPRTDAIRDGYKTLFELGALDDKNNLTPLGTRLSRIPVDPRVARIILAGHEENCLNEILIIAAALELQDPRERPLDKQQAADESHARFVDEDSDFLSYLKLWDFLEDLKSKLSRNQLRRACRQNFLSYNRVQEWLDVHRQLLDLVSEMGLKQHVRRNDALAVHRALLTGLLSNVGFKAETGNEYLVAGGSRVQLWPGSGLTAKKPKWIVAAELVETNKRYVRTVAKIDPSWIERLAAHLVTRSYSEPRWDAERANVTADEKVSLFGLTIVPRRSVNYGPIDPVVSRQLFIEHALVRGEYQSQGKFFAHNRALIEELEALQTKARRPGILRGEDAQYEFYDQRIPPHVFDGVRFEKWRRNEEFQRPQLLYMTRDDLLEPDTPDIAPADFPDSLAVRHMELPLAYCFDPGTDQDGITLTVPMQGLNQLDRSRLGWLVPGLLEEKVTAMIKSLPKAVRRQLVPASDTARTVLREIKFGQGDFNAAVAAILSRIAGEHIAPDAFQEAQLPAHLQLKICVINSDGKPLATGRDLQTLQRDLSAKASSSFTQMPVEDTRWRRDGITQWDFGNLPAQIDVHGSGVLLKGFPALLDRGESVSLRLLDAPERAAAETRRGLRRLFVLAIPRELKAQVNWLPDLEQLLVNGSTLGSGHNLRQQLAELLADRALYRPELAQSERLPTQASEFEARVKAAKNRLGLAVQDVTEFIGPLLEAYQEARLAVESVLAPPFQYAVADVRQQLSALIAPGFLTDTPWPWLVQFPRYFRGMKVRLTKLAGGGLQRDQRHAETLRPLLHAYAQRAEQHRARDVHDPQLRQYRWMLEEFRVSLFAQELKTSIPISEPRLQQQWERVAP